MKWPALLPALILAAAGAAAAHSAALPSANAEIRLRLHAPADRAFVLFDPVHEALWAPDWRPRFISASRVERGLVFVTRDGPAHTAWLLDRFEPAKRAIRYVNVRNGAIMSQIDIRVTPRGERTSTATVHYRRTALEASSAAEVLHFAEQFPAQGPHWEAAINAYLDAHQR